MSEIDELPSWAGRALQDPGAAMEAPSPPPSGVTERLKPAILALLGVILLAIIAAAAFAFLRGADDDVATDAPVTTVDSTEAVADEATSSDDSTATTTVAAPTTATTTSTTAASPTTQAATEDTTPASDGGENADGSARYAVFKGGQVFLRGRVPSEEVGAVIETRAGAVVGPDNVFNEYEIDPSAPASISAPLYVEDVVLFGFNSIRVETAFLPILDLGTMLLVQNPNVTVTVVTRTDAVGSEASNLRISEQRAQAVINYWLGKGIDPSRLIIDARGEEGTSEDDDEETKALSRRAEFVITGLLE
ncbi:MAG: OmpA family protein [Actinomycetia bacterium]|nr:OmpA family protein [Actinomycetes bacterium]MCP5033697.1 OmpA family protein [Actinomycetes bacterium]